MINWCKQILLGAAVICAAATSVNAQNRPAPGRPKAERPLEAPPALVVLEIDTTAGDSTRTIIQRDLDYGDRIQPLLLDSVTLDDIWRPGQNNINFAPLAQTRANFVVRARPAPTGLHVEIYDVPKGSLRQEGIFR